MKYKKVRVFCGIIVSALVIGTTGVYPVCAAERDLFVVEEIEKRDYNLYDPVTGFHLQWLYEISERDYYELTSFSFNDISDENFQNKYKVVLTDNIVKISDNAFNHPEKGSNNIKSVSIPSTVTQIGDSVFEGCTQLTEVKLLKNYVSSDTALVDEPVQLGDAVFKGCTSLQSVDLKTREVEQIGASIFEGCTNLREVKLSDSITSIPDNAFSDCSSLTSITIPNGVTEIGESAFSGCTTLTSITIPSSVEKIDASAFAGCTNLSQINIPEDVTFDGNPFEGTKWYDEQLKISPFVIVNGVLLDGQNASGNVIIPEGVKKISNHAFLNNKNITSVKCPSTLISIEERVFSGCDNLEWIFIDEGVTSIHPTAFDSPVPKFYVRVNSYAYKYAIANEISFRIVDNFFEKFDSEIGIELPVVDNTILCYDSDRQLSLGAKVVVGDGNAFNYQSTNVYVANISRDGKIEIRHPGETEIIITLAETELFKESELKLKLIVQKSSTEQEPAENPSNPDNSDETNTNPDAGDSNTSVDSGNADSNVSSGESENSKVDGTEQSETVEMIDKVEVTYGDNSFEVEAVSLEGKKIRYSSSNKKVFTVSSKGKVTIKGCGIAKLIMQTSDSVREVQIVVKPQKVKITSIRADKKKVLLKWKRDKKADGYYVYYSTDSKFKKSVNKMKISKNKVTKKYISKLKSNKNYYFKMRAYKKSGKSTVYSDYSKIYKQKIK